MKDKIRKIIEQTLYTNLNYPVCGNKSILAANLALNSMYIDDIDMIYNLSKVIEDRSSMDMDDKDFNIIYNTINQLVKNKLEDDKKKLPTFNPSERSMTERNPIISRLFEIDYNDSILNEKFQNETFHFSLTKNSLNLHINIFKEDELSEVIDRLSNIKKINIKRIDSKNFPINNILVVIKSNEFDYKIEQNWEENKSIHLIFTLSDIMVKL
jgi:hypothetical protein